MNLKITELTLTEQNLANFEDINLHNTSDDIDRHRCLNAGGYLLLWIIILLHRGSCDFTNKGE